MIARRGLSCAAVLLVLTACASLRPLTPYHDPLKPQEHLQLGMSYESQKMTQDAEREYEAAAGRDRRNVPGLLALGNLLYEQGRTKDAERALARAYRLAPSDKAVCNNLAMVYAREGKNLKKAEQLASSASDDPRLRPYALDTLASIYVEENRYADARQAIEAARAAAPPDDPNFLGQVDLTAQRISTADR